MRALIIVAALILVGVLIGWITFNKGPDHASVNIETETIRQDTKKAVDSGAQLLHKAGDKMEAEANQPAQRVGTNREAAPVSR